MIGRRRQQLFLESQKMDGEQSKNECPLQGKKWAGKKMGKKNGQRSFPKTLLFKIQVALDFFTQFRKCWGQEAMLVFSSFPHLSL